MLNEMSKIHGGGKSASRPDKLGRGSPQAAGGQKIKYRAVFKSSAWIFLIWGAIVILKGLYDVFWGLPESEFITLVNWARYSGFEVVYGIACVLTGLFIFEFAKRLPEILERE